MNAIKKQHINQELLKVLRDPFYGRAYPILQSLELIKKSGFFDDGLIKPISETPQFAARWFTTPVNKIINNIEKKSAQNETRYFVLLTTGSFCPIHKSHIEMMERAKTELENLGYIVLGGYLSPSHDSYVSDKCKHQTLSAMHRIRLCEEATVNSDWLMTDSWEAMHVSTAINFTEVISRLEHYLAYHLPRKKNIEIAYVFGSDNADFAYAFIEHGTCVCIKRPTFEQNFANLKANSLINHNPHIILGHDNTTEPGYSSQKIRQGDDAAMIDRVKTIYRSWQTQQHTHSEFKKATYYLRNEGAWAYSSWIKGRSPKMLESVWNEFLLSVCILFRDKFQSACFPDNQFDLDIKILDLSKQHEQAAYLTAGKKVISLDPCTKGDFNIGVSRSFLAGVGRHNPKLIARPGWDALETQINAIPPGDYVLLDDDIVTGGTIKNVMALFPSHIKIHHVISLASFAESSVLSADSSNERQRPIDIADCRDFLAGSNEGGLVIRLPTGKMARSPYMLPYVFPSDRASTPLSLDRQVSYELWKLNLKFFQKIYPCISLQESNTPFQELMLYLGFTKTDSMQSICQWHIDRLLR